MKLTKTEIVEYILAFVGIVGLLAYIHATAEAPQIVGALQTSPIMIQVDWAIWVDAGRPAIRFRDVARANVRV